MFRGLLASLLIACLAIPAMAATPHCQPQSQTTVAESGDDHHHHHREAKPIERQASSSPHDCIGCIAPYSGGLRVVSEALPLTVLRNAPIVVQLYGLAAAPALPPPRA